MHAEKGAYCRREWRFCAGKQSSNDLLCTLRRYRVSRLMRHLLSIALIAVVAQSAFAPLADALRLDQGPSCCRRKGKHHCNEMSARGAQASDDAAPAFHSVPEKCPLRFSVKARTISFAVSRVQNTLCLMAKQQVVSVGYVVFTTSGFSSHTDRGPPPA